MQKNGIDVERWPQGLGSFILKNCTTPLYSDFTAQSITF